MNSKNSSLPRWRCVSMLPKPQRGFWFLLGLTLPAIGLSWPASALADDSSLSIRVMTFNIRYNNPNDGDNAWPHRKDQAASMIRFHRPIVVGLQEALIGQLKDLDRTLPRYKRCGVGRDDGKQAGEFAAIYFRDDLLELKDSGTFWYSETPDTPSQGWDNNRRVVTWARLQPRAGDIPVFTVFNTHLGFTPEHREKMPALLRNRIRDLAQGPIVLMGDFNMRPGSEQYTRVLQGLPETPSEPQLRDALQVSQTPHHGPTGTFSGFKRPGTPGERIDFIFVGPGIDVAAHAVLSDTFDGRFPSDHLPVVADLILHEQIPD